MQLLHLMELGTHGSQSCGCSYPAYTVLQSHGLSAIVWGGGLLPALLPYRAVVGSIVPGSAGCILQMHLPTTWGSHAGST